MRHPLQKQLLTAWERAIENDYCNQRINSERSLQASVWSKLNSVLNPKTRRMFIEPRFNFMIDGETKQRFPDIVICNSAQVIAVIELKYQPRISPSYKKDIETLQLISKYRSKLRVVNSRFRGPSRDTKEYSFADSVLFVWAGIHRQSKGSFESNQIPMLSNGIDELDGCFVQLHAETDLINRPKVFSRFQ